MQASWFSIKRVTGWLHSCVLKIGIGTTLVAIYSMKINAKNLTKKFSPKTPKQQRL
ncbi:hypothetical protein T11_3492 [Trichinella zimbabwensis]|uniref:Uncharacterized protein n=1 Tax=Trichinella zimbabwensis TaxID=268475 RepID=A0A0V1GGW3_9BILA|nr:hypothetical protein T11_3492 [Trichinella zimbabwensis]